MIVLQFMSFVLHSLHMYYMCRQLNYISTEQGGELVVIVLLASVSFWRKKVVL